MQPGDVSKTYSDTNLFENWVKFRPQLVLVMKVDVYFFKRLLQN